MIFRSVFPPIVALWTRPNFKMYVFILYFIVSRLLTSLEPLDPQKWFIAPDRPNIVKADSKNKKTIKDLFFYFTVPPTLHKWLEKKLRTKKSSDRGLTPGVQRYPNVLNRVKLLKRHEFKVSFKDT